MTRLRLALPLALALIAASCARPARDVSDASTPSPAAAAAPGVTLVVTSALVGYLEPCGCSPDQLGGIARAAAVIDAIRKEGRPVVVLDTGDRFFPADGLSTDPLVRQQEQWQAQAMAEATRTMGYDALVLGERDSFASATFFSTERLPPLLDVGTNARPGTKPHLVIDAGGTRVGLVAVDGAEKADEVLRSRVAGLRAQKPDVVVLVAYRTFDAARALLPLAKELGVDVVLAARAEHPDTTLNAALPDSQPPLFQVQSRGEQLLRIDLFADGRPGEPFVRAPGAADRDADLAAMQQRIENMRREVTAMSPNDPARQQRTEKLLELEERRAQLANAPPPAVPAGQNAFTSAFVPMTPHLTPLRAVQAIVDRHHERVAEGNLEYVRANPKPCPQAPAGHATYVGAATCQSCHSAAYAFWEKTSHAQAYKTLADKKRQYDTQCIGCHVVGYEQPGGACSIADTQGRQAVQCESCHGPGSLHVQSGGKPDLIRLKVPEVSCRTCHDADNSPHFNDATYRPQIIGPGHGTPLAPR